MQTINLYYKDGGQLKIFHRVFIKDNGKFEVSDIIPNIISSPENGELIHPLDVKTGDVINFNPTEIESFEILGIVSVIKEGKYRISGSVTFEIKQGQITIYFDGDRVLQPIWKINI